MLINSGDERRVFLLAPRRNQSTAVCCITMYECTSVQGACKECSMSVPGVWRMWPPFRHSAWHSLSGKTPPGQYILYIGLMGSWDQSSLVWMGLYSTTQFKQLQGKQSYGLCSVFKHCHCVLNLTVLFHRLGSSLVCLWAAMTTLYRVKSIHGSSRRKYVLYLTWGTQME